MANLDSALTTSVSGLDAQGAAIATISQNIANASTTAYKSSATDFASLVTGSGATASGVVTSASFSNLTSQGSISATGTTTNIAIQGQGFFVVTDNTANQSSADNFSRNGAFTTDKNGFLLNNEGQYLLGQVTDSSGVVTAVGANDLTSLQPISVNATKGSAKATGNLSIGANLPADATVSPATPSVFTTSTEVFDSLGVSSTIDFTWTHTGSDAWNLTLSNPVLTNDPATTSGTTAPTSIDLTFNGDGSIDTVDGAPAAAVPITVTGWVTGASDSAINLNLGTAGTTTELTQFTSTGNTPQVEVTGISDDGVKFGKLENISIDSSGLVTAAFDNGLKEPVYQIPIATFANANGLGLINGSVYAQSTSSGQVVLQDPTQGTAGAIESSALEGSNVDTTSALSELVTSQQAYTASSKVISTVSTMFQALLQAIQ